MTLLEAKSIVKYFKEPEPFAVLQQVNLSIAAGEFVAIMGKSGCGKSTLLYVLSTMDTDYEGEVWLAGQRLTGLSESKLAAIRNQSLGFVFQFHYLLPEFTVLQNVMIPALRLNKYPKDQIEARALEKLRLLDIENQALKRASRLSGGQQQRVAIARALINDPLLILGDEPTGNLDSQNTQTVMDIFRSLVTQTGQTIVAVTHDENFAAACDRIIRMQDGKIIS